MIRIIEGNPGSGKSYYACNYLSKFATYDSLYGEWTLNPGILVISNIDGLKIKYLDLAALIERFTVEVFFTIDNFEKLIEKYRASHVILLIDEAQQIFDSKYYNKDVFYFFQYHRHLGIDIIMMTQSVSTIARHLIPLAENVTKAVERSKAIYKTFRYNVCDKKGLKLYSEVVKQNQNVFKMYKSFTFDEKSKPKNAFVNLFIMMVICIVVCVFLFKSLVHSYTGNPKKSQLKPTENKPVQKQISSVSPSMPTLERKETAPKRTVNPHPSIPTEKPLHVPAIKDDIQPPKADELRLARIDAYAVIGGKTHLYIRGRKIDRFDDFDLDSMTAMVPAKFAGRDPLAGGDPANELPDKDGQNKSTPPKRPLAASLPTGFAGSFK